MKYCVIGAAFMVLSACNGMPQATRSGHVFTEFLVLGSPMSFAECTAKGGLIIQDRDSPMVACDPTVLGAQTPLDEFDHPGVDI